MNSNNFADRISQVSLERYNTLGKTGKPNENEWTVLCTIVEDCENSLKVVALGTGTKCIGKTQMSQKGCIINDSHAEVVCRRAFMRYLYNEMIALNSKILQIHSSNKFQLINDVKYHLFSTLMPCGDASIFHKLSKMSENDEQLGSILCEKVVSENCMRLNKKRRLDKDDDIHRTGAKCLPENNEVDLKLPRVDYHVLNAIRTKPGRGDATLSVSCSDKMSKWICLGIQGNLLSELLIAPVYLTSITIGNTIFDKDALQRALYKRFANDNHDEFVRNNEMFKLHIPHLYQSVMYDFSAQKCDRKRVCPSSIVYFYNEKVEVAVDGHKQGVTKMNRNTSKGRLKICKIEFFNSFCNVARKLGIDVDVNSSYFTFKHGTEYSKAWEHLKKYTFKIWTKKDKKLEEFLSEIN